MTNDKVRIFIEAILILLLTVLMTLFISKPAYSGSKHIDHIVKDGVECMIYHPKGGISCNWEAYNKAKNSPGSD